MTRAAWLGLIAAALVGVSSCGGDNTTNFVLQSGSPSASPSAASASASGSPSPDSSQIATVATPIADGLKIIIDSPDGGGSISSPVDVSGTASVDNGTVVAVVLDSAGKELGRATTLATASKPDFGHYAVSVNFSGGASGSKGQLKVFGVSPRDGKTPTNYYFISVRFS
jgi:hypothetical protein